MDRPISLEARRIDLRIEPPFRLGRLRVDPPAHEYAIDGVAARIQPQTLKVLIALHGKLGQVVTRDELVDRCWDGRIVGEDVINRCISLLRRLAVEGRFHIETIPRGGYRLLESPHAPKTAHIRRMPVLIVAGAAAALAAILFLVDRPPTANSAVLAVAVSRFSADDGGSRTKEVAARAEESVVRMLTESGLSVQVATSEQAAERLGADMLVSGDVTGNGDGPVASVRIEDLHDHSTVLSHRLESDWAHSADLPDQVGANLAAALSWTGPLILLDQRPTDSAFMAQLLDEVSNQDFDELRAFEFNRRNAPNAPNSPIAQLAFAMDTGLVVDDVPKEERAGAISMARQAAERARRLAPGFGDVYIPWCLLHPQVQMASCEDHLRAGLMADPQAPFVRFFLSNLMNSVGRTNDALTLAYASLAQDQYVPTKIGQLAGMQEAVGDSADADALYRSGLRLWPHDQIPFFRRAKGFLQRGDIVGLDRFELEFGRASAFADYPFVTPIAKAVEANSSSGLRAACPLHSRDLRAVECMIALARFGDLDDAYRFADELYPPAVGPTSRDEERIWLYGPGDMDTAYLTSRAGAPMRRDPRYLALAQRVGLLAYWRTGRLPDFCTDDHEPVCAHIVARH